MRLESCGICYLIPETCSSRDSIVSPIPAQRTLAAPVRNDAPASTAAPLSTSPIAKWNEGHPDVRPGRAREAQTHRVTCPAETKKAASITKRPSCNILSPLPDAWQPPRTKFVLSLFDFSRASPPAFGCDLPSPIASAFGRAARTLRLSPAQRFRRRNRIKRVARHCRHAARPRRE